MNRECRVGYMRKACTRDTVEVTTSHGLLARHVLPTFTRVTLACASASFRVSARRSARTRGFGRPILLRMIYMRSRNASWLCSPHRILLCLHERFRSSSRFAAPDFAHRRCCNPNPWPVARFLGDIEGG